MKKILIQDDNEQLFLINHRDKEIFYQWVRDKYIGGKFQYQLTASFDACKIERLSDLIIKDYSLEEVKKSTTKEKAINIVK